MIRFEMSLIKILDNSPIRSVLRTIGACLKLSFLLPLILLGCGADSSPRPNFDGARALSFIEKQVSFGPRVPGTEASRKCQDYLSDFFDSLGYNSQRQEFVHRDSQTNETIKMTNLIFERKRSSKTQAATRILLCAHYDSRPRCDRDPDPERRNDSLPGANDGGSGVAVLMELAIIFDSVSPQTQVDFVFFDGEDWGAQGDINQYCLGSIEFAEKIAPMRYRFAILLDIVGHAEAKFNREGNSEKYANELNDRFWEIGLEMRPNRFVDSVGISIMDDHIPLLGARIPTIDIIDLSYPQWHTSSDLPEYCDSTALSDIGEVVAEIVYRERN